MFGVILAALVFLLQELYLDDTCCILTEQTYQQPRLFRSDETKTSNVVPFTHMDSKTEHLLSQDADHCEQTALFKTLKNLSSCNATQGKVSTELYCSVQN